MIQVWDPVRSIHFSCHRCHKQVKSSSRFGRSKGGLVVNILSLHLDDPSLKPFEIKLLEKCTLCQDRKPFSRILSVLKREKVGQSFLIKSCFEICRKERGVWPDVGIKSCPKIIKIYLNVVTAVFIQRVIFFKIAQKVTTYLGYFCLQELSELARSGHTERSKILLFL